MELTQSKYLVARCGACGWEGVPVGRRVRVLFGPLYVLIAVIAVFASTFAGVEERLLVAPVVGFLVSAAALDLFLRYRERCLACGGRKLESEFR